MIDLCERCETIELWIDPDPNAQLTLIWLLDHQRHVFSYWEGGSLLDGLAHCPAPAVSGLGNGPFTEEFHNDHLRHERYIKSRLSLTALGEALLTWKEDFSRHNPIHRWWGGTELTNDRLWRWDPANRALITP